MTKCKYSKKCEYYDEMSHTCNKDQFKEDGNPYCGKFRELSKVLIVMFVFIFLINFTLAGTSLSPPVAQYRLNTQNFSLNNQTFVVDSMGLNNGTLVGKTFNNGNVTGTIPLTNNVFNFDGSASNIYTTTYLPQNLTTLNPYTISFWFNPSSCANGSQESALVTYRGSLVGNSTGFDLSSSCTVKFMMRNDTSTGTLTGGVLGLNTWYHILGVYNGSTMLLYYNGVLNSSSSSSIREYSLVTASTTLNIGRRIVGGNVDNLNGSLNNVLIYNRSLSSSEISQIYALGKDEYTNISDGLVAQYSGRDYAGSSDAPTTIYDTNHLVKGQINQGFGFNGLNSYITAPVQLINATPQLSFSTWFKVTGGTGNTDWILRQGSQAFGLNIGSLGGSITMSFRAENGTYYSSASQSVSSNIWHHVAGSFNNNTGYSFYLNGVNVQNVSMVVLGLRNDSATTKLEIGRHVNDANSFFNGSIDDVRIYNRSLSATEIAMIYADGENIYYTNLSTMNVTNIQLANGTILTGTNITVPENANVTFTATGVDTQNYNSTWFSWFVDGISQLAGFGQNIFNWVFNNQVTNPSSNVSLYMNDSTGEVTQNFTVNTQTAIPVINSASLLNATIYNVGDNQTLIYNITDNGALSTCWYQYNNANTTFNCSSNTKNITTVAGQTNIIVYANDTVGNNATPVSLSFAYDTVAPTITLNSPANLTAYNTSSWGNISINFSVNDTNLQACKWNYNNGANNSITCNTNISYAILDGLNIITLYANDTLGNLNSNALYILGGNFSVNISNATTSVILANGSSNWSNNANLTFNSSAPSSNFFTWILDGITWLTGFGQNVFSHVFNLSFHFQPYNVTLITNNSVQQFDVYSNSGNIVLNSPSNGEIIYTNSGLVNFTISTDNGADLANASLFTNETGSWAVRNTTTIPINNFGANTTKAHGVTISTVAGQTDFYGMRFNYTNTTYTISSIKAVSGAGCDRGRIYHLNGTIITTSPSAVGGIMYFNPNYTLEGGKTYRVECDTPGTNQRRYSMASFPVTSDGVTWIGGSTAGTNDTSWNNIESINVSSLVGSTSSNPTFTNTYPAGSVIKWNAYGCDVLGSCGFSPVNYTFVVDQLPPQIALNYPTALIDYGSNGGALQLNYTITDTNLDKCWYDYYGTNVTTACSSGVPVLRNITLLTGIKNVTIYANDTAGNLNSTTFSWNYKVWENSRTFNATSLELLDNTYILNLTDNVNTTSVTLNYDGTDYSATGSGGVYTTTLTAPAVNTTTNKTLYWKVLYNNLETINTISSLQAVQPVVFNICNSTVNNTLVTFLTRSSTNPFPLVNTTFKVAFDYTLSIGGTQKTFNYEDIVEDNSSYSFCSDTNLTIYTNADIEYDAVGYALNFYYLTGEEQLSTLSPSNISIYLLNDSAATVTQIKVQDSSQRGLNGYRVDVYSYDTGTGTYYLVGMAKTDFNGLDIFYFNWFDTIYKLLVYDPSGTLVKDTGNTKVANTPVTITLGDSVNFTQDKFLGFTKNLSFNPVTNNFVLTFTKPSVLVQGVCLRVDKQNNSGNNRICDTCTNATSATLYCSVGSYGNGTYIAYMYATGSRSILDLLYASIGGEFQDTIYAALGNKDASFYAFLFATLVMLAMFVHPVMGILGLLLGIMGASALGFTSLNWSQFLGIAVVGGIIIWVLKK